MKLRLMLIYPLILLALVTAGCKNKDDGSKDGTARQPATPQYSSCEPNRADFPSRPAPENEATLSFLHAEGTELYNEEGQMVALRGINFGSWLMMESWIAGIGQTSEEQLLLDAEAKAAELGIAELFGKARATNSLEWIAYIKPHKVMVEQWREYMNLNANEDQLEAVEQFWQWFDGKPWVYEEFSLWRWLDSRFGFEKSEQLREAFADNYITELDVKRVAELGLNLIRVPVWYQALETDYADNNGFRPQGWRHLDDIVDWARKYGVYVMIDLHGAPGGQSVYWHQGLPDGGRLWTEQACVEKTARLWKAIASYYADEPHVAVYDVLNEPASAPDYDTYKSVHDAIYRAIREVDERHIVMLENGFLPADRLASPSEMGWTNAMFSIHFYPGGTSATNHLQRMESEVRSAAELYRRYNVPLFVGEFNVYGPTDFEADDTEGQRWEPRGMSMVLDMMNRRGISWAPWTWKFFGDRSLWGVYHPAAGSWQRINVGDADFETILADFNNLNSENFEPDGQYAQAFVDNATAPVALLNLGEVP